MVGAVNIRHYLNDSLLLNGGHMGDGNEILVNGIVEQRYWININK